MTFPFLTTEPLPDGVQLNIKDDLESPWQREKFGTWEELEIWLHQNGYVK
jgi:hypothetical protein